MVNRYQQDLKKIVGLDETNKGLAPAEEREPIVSTRGVGYIAGGSGTVVGQQVGGGSAGSSLPPSTDPVIGPTETSGAWQAGGTAGGGSSGGTTNPRSPTNPESGIKYEGANIYDAADLIDGTAGPLPYDATTPYNSTMVAGISGMVDCVDNQDITLFLDGGNDSPGFPPPEGWDDAETPPTSTDATWQSGYYWKSVWAFATPKATPRQAAEEIESGIANREFKDFTPSYSPSATSLTANFWILPGKTSTQGFGLTRYTCPSITSFPSDPEACVGEAPDDPFDAAATEWPSDNTLSLKWDGTKISKSQYEPDVPTGWNQDGSSTLSFCMAGGRYGEIQPTADGGLVIYETSSERGAPISGGFYRQYSPSGALVGYGDNSSLASVLPRT